MTPRTKIFRTSLAEAASLLDISPDLVYKLGKCGFLPTDQKDGGEMLFDMDDLLNFFEILKKIRGSEGTPKRRKD